jgi:hypothetical protein
VLTKEDRKEAGSGKQANKVLVFANDDEHVSTGLDGSQRGLLFSKGCRKKGRHPLHEACNRCVGWGTNHLGQRHCPEDCAFSAYHDGVGDGEFGPA